jgi:hypothetical protein
VAWIRIDDQYDEHPKFAKAGPLGIALWLGGLAYCNRNLTDGFIPWSTARSLVTWQYLDPESNGDGRKVWTVGVTCGGTGSEVQCDQVIKLLVGAGLWEERDCGYYVHDYPIYQPLKAQVLAEREATRKRVSLFRRNAVTPSVTPTVSNSVSTLAPVPVPVPKEEEEVISASSSLSTLSINHPLLISPSNQPPDLPKGEMSALEAFHELLLGPTRRGLKRPPSDDLPKGEMSALEAFHELFWTDYPRKVAKRDALDAWKALKLKDTDQEALEAIMAGLQRSKRSWKGREKDKIPYPATWLNGRRWLDEEE